MQILLYGQELEQNMSFHSFDANVIHAFNLIIIIIIILLSHFHFDLVNQLCIRNILCKKIKKDCVFLGRVLHSGIEKG